MRTVADYLDLIAGEHRGKPKYEATITLLTAPMAAMQQFLQNLPQAFNLDTAIGAQLDIDGIWIGQSRYIDVPLPDVFFSFDTNGLGWDEGVWFGPFTPSEGLVSFDDNTYRALLRAKIIANHWDGTVTQMQQALQTILNPYPSTILGIVDNYNMSMDIGLSGIMPPRLVFYLVSGGYVPFKPEGVQLNVYITSIPNTPLFGMDVESNFISGLDVGTWGVPPLQVTSLPVYSVTNVAGAVGIGTARVIATTAFAADAATLHGIGNALGATSVGGVGATLQAVIAIAGSGTATASPLQKQPTSATLAGTGTVRAIASGYSSAAIQGVGSVVATTSTAAHTQQGVIVIHGAGASTVIISESTEGTQLVLPQ